MSATIEDVARRAKVSVATVSRALRGLPNVAPSTRARVLAAAEELHYVADPYASRLAAGRRHAIGFVVPMLGQWFFAKLFSGVEGVLAAAGYEVLPFPLSGPGGADEFLAALPFRKRVDGLVVAEAPFTGEHLERIARGGVPFVTLGLRSTFGPSLVIDNVGAARLAVGHLTGLGHRRIAIIGPLDDDPFHFSVPVERHKGYREALETAGVELDDDLVVPGNFSLEGGAEAMQTLLAHPEPPTAVFACSDEMAIGAMQVARDAGLEVPEDLSVVGFDDHDVSEYIGLTTIRQDVIGQGERVSRLLLALLDGGSEPDTHEVYPTRLVVRHTTARPRSVRSLR